MTAVQPARPVPPEEAGPVRRIPFPTVDEVSLHCVRDTEPETVHLEVHLPGRIDADRLRASFHEAMLRHPRVLMRKRPSRWWHLRYAWELTPAPDTDPVVLVPAAPGALERARERTMTDPPPLDTSPPVRLEAVGLADGGTVLMLTVNHTAMDGPACLRVLATAAELYAGTPPPASPPAPPQSTAPTGPPTPPPDAAPPSAPTRPVRIAGDTRKPAEGNGMLLLDLPAPRRTGYGATVNDQLLVATCLMVARWNRAHDRPPGPVQITMPVDDRPRLAADMPIGNGTRLTEVGFGPEEHEDRDLLTADPPDQQAVERLLRRTMTRTHALKTESGHPLGLSGVLLTAPVLPVAWRAALARALRRVATPFMSTTLVSNIGRVPYAFDFGPAGKSTAVWLSAPSRPPRGLTVTAASTANRLHITLRWSRSHLDTQAAHRLATLLQEGLTACED